MGSNFASLRGCCCSRCRALCVVRDSATHLKAEAAAAAGAVSLLYHLEADVALLEGRKVDANLLEHGLHFRLDLSCQTARSIWSSNKHAISLAFKTWPAVLQMACCTLYDTAHSQLQSKNIRC